MKKLFGIFMLIMLVSSLAISCDSTPYTPPEKESEISSSFNAAPSVKDTRSDKSKPRCSDSYLSYVEAYNKHQEEIGRSNRRDAEKDYIEELVLFNGYNFEDYYVNYLDGIYYSTGYYFNTQSPQDNGIILFKNGSDITVVFNNYEYTAGHRFSWQDDSFEISFGTLYGYITYTEENGGYSKDVHIVVKVSNDLVLDIKSTDKCLGIDETEQSKYNEKHDIDIFINDESCYSYISYHKPSKNDEILKNYTSFESAKKYVLDNAIEVKDTRSDKTKARVSDKYVTYRENNKREGETLDNNSLELGFYDYSNFSDHHKIDYYKFCKDGTYLISYYNDESEVLIKSGNKILVCSNNCTANYRDYTLGPYFGYCEYTKNSSNLYDGNGCFIIKVSDELVTKLTTSSKKTIDNDKHVEFKKTETTFYLNGEYLGNSTWW